MEGFILLDGGLMPYLIECHGQPISLTGSVAMINGARVGQGSA